MARATIIIRESAEELTDLLSRPENARHAPRLRMLALLKAYPQRTLDAVAVELGVSPRSIYRWWGAYRKEGLVGLLGGSAPAAPKRGKMGSRERDELKRALLAGELDGLREIQEWVAQRYGVRYSLKGIAEMVRRMGMERRWMDNGRDIRMMDGRVLDYERIMKLFNDMPIGTDVAVCVAKFRDILQECMADVDRISVSVNIACDLHDPEDYTPHNGVMHSIDMESREVGIDVRSGNDDAMIDDARYQIEKFRDMGMPVDDCHFPIVTIYYFQKAYIGRIFLWRKIGERPISDETVSALKNFEEVIVFIMTAIALRHNYMNPHESKFYNGISRIHSESRLTARERNVLIYRLFGYAYKEIADKLDVAEDRIKKLVRSIHRKTKTGSHVELVAKYFTPRIPPLKED